MSNAPRPFAIAGFRRLWLLALSANLAVQIQTIAAAWTMTQMGSAATVALVQSAATLPVMLFACVAGALADMTERRRVLLAAYLAMFAAGVGLALLSVLGGLNPPVLLALSFVFGCGTALFGPAMLASVSEEVPKTLVADGVTSISISYNLARSVGPAVGGLLLAFGGPTVAFLINTVLCVAMVMLIVLTPRKRQAAPLRPEGLPAALATGLRFVVETRGMHIVLGRTVLFAGSASSVWALLPLVARGQFAGGPGVFGLLMSALGVGAIAFALVARPIRDALGHETMVRLFTIFGGLSLLAIPFSPSVAIAMLALFVIGACWTGALTIWNVTAQWCAPRWLAGRAVAAFQTAMFGGMALGSWMWGHVAEGFGVGPALIASGLLLTLTVLAGLQWPAPASPAGEPIETGEAAG